jgi:hypothetical protein
VSASRVVLALTFGLVACAQEPAVPRLTPAPGGGLPVEVRAMIHGDDTPCATGEDCLTGQCLFGRCSGVVRTDEPWRTELVADRLVGLIGEDAALRQQVVEELVRLGATPDLSEPTRARLFWAVERVGGAAALEAAAPDLDALPESLQAVVALGLTRHGDPRGISLVLALTESERPALRVEALRALGGLGDAAPELVKARLLAVATGEVDEMEALAALGALAELRPPGAVAPLLALAEGGRDALREPALLALARVTGEAHGSEPAAWRTALEAKGLPTAIAFTPVVARPEDDIGLPDP